MLFRSGGEDEPLATDRSLPMVQLYRAHVVRYGATCYSHWAISGPSTFVGFGQLWMLQNKCGCFVGGLPNDDQT